MASEQQEADDEGQHNLICDAGRVPEAAPRSNRSAAGCVSKFGQTALAAA